MLTLSVTVQLPDRPLHVDSVLLSSQGPARREIRTGRSPANVSKQTSCVHARSPGHVSAWPVCQRIVPTISQTGTPRGEGGAFGSGNGGHWTADAARTRAAACVGSRGRMEVCVRVRISVYLRKKKLLALLLGWRYAQIPSGTGSPATFEFRLNHYDKLTF